VFTIDASGLHLIELAPSVSVDEVKKRTEATFHDALDKKAA
jgi:acyl CoA:acetate/3-ketoacid CoA transferase beta subunit